MLHPHLPTRVPFGTLNPSTKPISAIQPIRSAGSEDTDNKQRYRLTTGTPALIQADDRRIIFCLPAGTVLTAPTHLVNAMGLVTVEWDGKTIQIFAVDLIERGERLQEGTTEPEVPEFRSARTQKYVTLVADDEPLIRNLVTLLLQDEGHFVISAADGQEALELSREYVGLIDLVITDLDMPRMNGIDLCRHLMQERPTLKFLATSGAGAETGEIIVENTHLPFVAKPFDAATLRARVQAALAPPASRVPGSEAGNMNYGVRAEIANSRSAA
jgi:CheY-like chemotaxis protein